MKKTSRILAVIICLALATSPEKPSEVNVVIDGKSSGRIFDGIGALSAGASSRLLIDYPEPQRSDILDILFKPGFAASLHHLKVEIGGDINSTDGSEPSHARTREEFLHPRREYFDRGYEWWLMEEAKKRNLKIFLDVLQWGAPPWIGDRDTGITAPKSRRFFSQDNADFIASFIRGAKIYHDLSIDYCGIWNETPYDVEWIKILRRTLDTKGLESVRIVAADQTSTVAPVWDIANDIQADTTLARAVHTIGVHYPSNAVWKFALKEPFASTPEAKKTGKPLWASEDGPWRGDWEGARWLAKIFNRNYAVGRMTKTVIWSLITSYYDNLPIPGSGPMKANRPWSGSYEVQPGIWAIAHTTQFAQPGWQYLDSSCGLLSGGGSFVTLRDPNFRDWSMIIETIDAKGPQTLSAHVIGGLLSNRVIVWKTTEGRQFEEQLPIAPSGGTFSLKLDPNAIYSLTTTTGQQKGHPPHLIPPATELRLPFSDDFENDKVGRSPRYLSDLNGAFEVVQRPDGDGKCLSQVVTSLGIDWPLAEQPTPRTIIGSRSWIDYEVSCDVQLRREGWAAVCARFDKVWNSGYWLTLSADGVWKLETNEKILAGGRLRGPPASRWHRLSVACKGDRITGTIDEQGLVSVRDTTFRAGFAGLGTGWNRALFDNFLAY
jgi:hypothetical protein